VSFGGIAGFESNGGVGSSPTGASRAPDEEALQVRNLAGAGEVHVWRKAGDLITNGLRERMLGAGGGGSPMWTEVGVIRSGRPGSGRVAGLEAIEASCCTMG